MANEPFDVFLSFNSEDRAQVEKIAVHLTQGANLSAWYDKWELVPGFPWQDGIEAGLKASSSCAAFIGKSGQGPWERMEIQSALQLQVQEKKTRVIPVLLPEAPTNVELPSFLKLNHLVDWRGRNIDGDALWHLECGIRGISPKQGRPKLKSQEPQAQKRTTYVERGADEVVLHAVKKMREPVTVRGSWHSGKTALLLRVHTAIQQEAADLRSVFIDLWSLEPQSFATVDSLWKAILSKIASQLELSDWFEAQGESGLGYDEDAYRFFDHLVPKTNTDRLLICLDDADLVFNFPVKDDFFASLRFFYNRGAENTCWKNVRWLLSTSSEPSFFIEDLTQSPFGIGTRVELSNFTGDEVAELASRYQLTLDENRLNDIMNYTRGKPHLVNLLFQHLAEFPYSYKDLLDARTAAHRVFRDHLRRYSEQFEREGTLKAAMKSIVAGDGCPDMKVARRLEAVGLVRRDAQGKIIPLCRLYAEFFQ